MVTHASILGWTSVQHEWYPLWVHAICVIFYFCALLQVIAGLFKATRYRSRFLLRQSMTKRKFIGKSVGKFFKSWSKVMQLTWLSLFYIEWPNISINDAPWSDVSDLFIPRGGHTHAQMKTSRPLNKVHCGSTKYKLSDLIAWRITWDTIPWRVTLYREGWDGQSHDSRGMVQVIKFSWHEKLMTRATT